MGDAKLLNYIFSLLRLESIYGKGGHNLPLQKNGAYILTWNTEYLERTGFKSGIPSIFLCKSTTVIKSFLIKLLNYLVFTYFFYNLASGNLVTLGFNLFLCDLFVECRRLFAAEVLCWDSTVDKFLFLLTMSSTSDSKMSFDWEWSKIYFTPEVHVYRNWGSTSINNDDRADL